MKGRAVQKFPMEGILVRPMTLRSIRGHDVLLDTAHDFLDSSVKPSGQHNRKPNSTHFEV